MKTRDITEEPTTTAPVVTKTKIATGTASAVFAPIIKALVECEGFVQGISHEGWMPSNLEQRIFLERFYAHRHELEAFGPDELKAWVRKTAEELNQILADHKYEIRLEPWPDNEGSFGVVAIMDALARWIHPGERQQIYCKNNGLNYPGVKITRHAHEFSSPAHPHPLLAIQAQDNYEVWMTAADEPLSGLDLVCRVQDIRDAGLHLEVSNVHGHFPMINLNQKVDIGWLKGIHAVGNDTGQPVIITQALQETKFRMNEFGAHAQSAVALGAKRCMGPKSVYIDQPFYLWILKDMGAGGPKLKNIPVFAGYLDTDCWEDPGTIE